MRKVRHLAELRKEAATPLAEIVDIPVERLDNYCRQAARGPTKEFCYYADTLTANGLTNWTGTVASVEGRTVFDFEI